LQWFVAVIRESDVGISVTHNDDGTITVECGGEELTFTPPRRVKSASTGGGSGTGGFGGGRFIPTETGPRVSVFIPMGDQPPDLPIVEWDGEIRFHDDLLEQVRKPYEPPHVFQVRLQPGMPCEISQILVSAKDAAETSGVPLELWLTPPGITK
jgi:hypothetical protein